MTRWSMVADLRRCVGCQTCTAACKHANATSPAVQWRKVLDLEVGVFPEVGRVFIPVGCMHCSDPPCMHVCPSTATGQREDGIVTIDYDLCIGCAYCAVACPYQARYKVGVPRPAYGRDGQMRIEKHREEPARVGVAQKCTFCSDKIDYGLANGLTPGIDPDATPACVNSCIAGALHFGDKEDPNSNISKLLDENRHFRMHEELETNSGFYYLWEKALSKPASESDNDDTEAEAELSPSLGVGGVGAAAPWLQQHWDWRAAANFIGGGTGTGMMVAASVSALFGTPIWPFALLALIFVAGGLSMVWTELGRPWRALNVIFHPQTSWMTREALVAPPLFISGLAAAWYNSALIGVLAALFALLFLYCQARMLHGGKGIPIWRENLSIPLLVSTGLVEGAALMTVASAYLYPYVTQTVVNVMLLLVIVRSSIWRAYRRKLANNAPDKANAVLKRAHIPLTVIGSIIPFALVIAGLLMPEIYHLVFPLAALSALVGGWMMKFIIVTRAAYNQGYAITHTPERAAGSGGGQGAQPGWKEAV
jgi:Fe-S-cluster-containing dehydrogenase component/DMSO reductase anchor subunit